MTNEDIKRESERLYKVIADANIDLGSLRYLCKHESTKIVNYSFRLGHVTDAEMCEYCGELIK
jgi:hypothetical protein